MSAILVISGGVSPEREVSLRSGQAVVAALEENGHTVTTYDPQSGALSGTPANTIAFPVLHGVGGEDGQIQAALEQVGLPYVGSDFKSSKLCFDKVAYKQLLRANGLPTPDFALIDSLDSLQHHPLTTRPYVLKPYNGGSSIDTFIVRDPVTANLAAMAQALERNGSMLLEELVEGTEITVAVLGDKGLPVIEIIPPTSGEFDYENKYNGASQELCPPLHVDRNIQVQAQELAASIHALCGCSDYSRTDMIVQGSGQLMVLETNTLPGMTAQSLFPKAAAVAGITMPQLCEQLVQMALSRQTASA